MLQGRLHGRAIAIDCDAPRQAAATLQDQPGIRSAALYGEAVHVTVERPELIYTLEQLLVARGIAVHAVRGIEPSLEDVFIDLTTESHAA
jgi:sulfur transfer complex TusBCD TusB component (DsrH family)